MTFANTPSKSSVSNSLPAIEIDEPRTKSAHSRVEDDTSTRARKRRRISSPQSTLSSPQPSSSAHTTTESHVAIQSGKGSRTALEERMRATIEQMTQKMASIKYGENGEPDNEDPVTLDDRLVADVSSLSDGVINRVVKSVGIRVDIIDGKLYIKELSSTAHEAAKKVISDEIAIWNGANGRMLKSVGNATYRFGGLNKEPDDCWYHRDRPSLAQAVAVNGRGPYPSLILEVAHSEGLRDVVDFTRNTYLAEQNVQLVLVIKLYKRRPNGTFAALAMLFDNSVANPANPTAAISFGTASLGNTTRAYLNGQGIAWSGVGVQGTPPNNALGIVDYQVNLPIAEVFHRGFDHTGALNFVPAADMSGGVAANIVVDLFRVQQDVDGSLP